jgi:hypothetical protein
MPKERSMRLNHADGFFRDVSVPAGKTAVTFLVEGGPAICEIYKRDDSGGHWLLIEKKAVRVPGVIADIEVKAGWWIRIQTSPLDDQRVKQTRAIAVFR